MIPFDFLYLRPESLAEAVQAYEEAEQAGRRPVYYAGGSEIVSFCRRGKIRPGAVIDIKAVPECREHSAEGGRLRLGAALTLNELIAADSFPLLSASAAGIADHTLRNRITLGGNIAGMLPYREALLPLLVSGGTADCAGPEGRRTVPFAELFDRRLGLRPGELLVACGLEKSAAAGAWFHRRRVQGTRTDYPLVTACFLVWEGEIRLALGGALNYPFWAAEVDELLNRRSVPAEKTAAAVLEKIGGAFREDFRASADYRRHLLKNILVKALSELGGKQ
jgi:CO/xanthine dehydrogenase FAD-binding subunit